MISEKIKAIRNLFDLSQKDFANKLNVSFRRIQDYEYGRTAPSFDVLQKIIQEFQIEPDYFFETKNQNLAGVLPESKKNLAGVHSSPQDLSPNHQKVVSQSVSQSSKSCLPIHSSPQEENMSLSQEKNVTKSVTKSEFDVLLSQSSPQENLSINDSIAPTPPSDPSSYYIIPKLTLSAQAGGGNEILDLECYESGETLTIDKAFFRAIPQHKLKAIKVEGYSMIPMLFPDSWVVFEEGREYRGDGLYIINYAGQLMVKLLQLDPMRKILDIVSVNKEYKSYSISLLESQVEIIIIGKVLRCII